MEAINDLIWMWRGSCVLFHLPHHGQEFIDWVTATDDRIAAYTEQATTASLMYPIPLVTEFVNETGATLRI